MNYQGRMPLSGCKLLRREGNYAKRKYFNKKVLSSLSSLSTSCCDAVNAAAAAADDDDNYANDDDDGNDDHQIVPRSWPPSSPELPYHQHRITHI